MIVEKISLITLSPQPGPYLLVELYRQGCRQSAQASRKKMQSLLAHKYSKGESTMKPFPYDKFYPIFMKELKSVFFHFIEQNKGKKPYIFVLKAPDYIAIILNRIVLGQMAIQSLILNPQEESLQRNLNPI